MKICTLFYVLFDCIENLEFYGNIELLSALKETKKGGKKMNVAEWILVAILSITLLVFLIVGIIALVKWNHLVDEAKKVVIKGQDIAETANDIAENVKGITSIGSVVKNLTNRIETDAKKSKKPEKKV